MALPKIVYRDIDVTMKAHPITQDILTKTGASAIVQSLANLIQYGHYEKPFHPEIGANIRQLLFELADPVTAGLIENEIRTVVANFEPRVALIAVAVGVTDDLSGYNVTIEFTIISLPNPISISVFLERVR